MSKVPRWGIALIVTIVVGVASFVGAALLLRGDDLTAGSGVGLVFLALFSLLVFASPLVAVVIVVKRGAEWDDARRAREAVERRYLAALERGELDDTLD
jgi:Na+-transporting methylmalonyl-CoA/oxaloacetate decarboxylase gamma subunit